MKTDATSGVSGAASTPLSYQAIQSNRNLIKQNSTSTKPSEAITDTLETTDREGDGRQPLESNLHPQKSDSNVDAPSGLDLTG